MKNFGIKLIGQYLDLINRISKSLGAKHSFYVFCYPFKIKITEDQQNYLNTSEKFRLPLDRSEIQVYKWGNGPCKVLFVHGWRSNAFRWKPYISKLSKEDFTVYAFDAPGHGNSSSLFGNVYLFARAIETVVNHLGEVDTLIGHSVAGFASIYFMHTNPQHKIQRFVSLASPGSANDFVAFYVNALNLSSRTEQNLRSYFITYTGKTIEQFDLRHTMDNMPAKGLIIHDKDDADVPIKYAQEMHDRWPESNIVVTSGFGHKLRHRDVIDRVIDFIK